MSPIQQFEDLQVWQKSRELTKLVYAIAKTGTFSKDFGLRDQIQRSAVSVMANIAEGFERGGDKEFGQFLSLAKGSCGEVRSHLHVAADQGYITKEAHNDLAVRAVEISRMISGLMTYLKTSGFRGNKFAPKP